MLAPRFTANDEGVKPTVAAWGRGDEVWFDFRCCTAPLGTRKYTPYTQHCEGLFLPKGHG